MRLNRCARACIAVAAMLSTNAFSASAETGGNGLAAIPAGAVVLSGHAGTQGHEGDITLRIDSLRTDDGRFIAFADQRIEINGRNRKVAAALLGFVPYAGFGARFIRGSEIEVAADRPISTVLARPAPLVDAVPSAAPASPAASRPAATASPIPTPTASPVISPQPESIPEATSTASP